MATDNWFKQRLRDLGKRQEDLADAIHRDRTAVTRILNGQARLHISHVKPFAEILEVDPLEILYHANLIDNNLRNYLKMMPKAGTIGDGDKIVYVPLISARDAVSLLSVGDIGLVQQETQIVPVPHSHDSLVALRVAGDSMNLIAEEGATLIVDYTAREPEPNRYYLIAAGTDEPVFRRYRADPPRFEPVSNNLSHTAIFDVGAVQVIGRVIKILRITEL